MLRLAPLAMLLIAANARAQPRIPHPVQLEYIRGEGTRACPSEGGLRHLILSRMKEDPFSPTAQAKARVAIVRVGSAFQGSYELLNDAEEYVAGQTLPRRDDCINALTDVGLAVSLYMPLLLTDSTPQPAASASQPAASSPARTELAPLTPPRGGGGVGGHKPAAKPARPIVGRFDGGVLMSFGTAPMVAFGASLHGGAQWRFLSLSAGVRFEFSLPDGTDTVRITTSRMLAEVVPCGHWDVGFGVAFGCGVVQFGGLSVTGKSKEDDFSRTLNATSVSIGARLGLQHHFQFLPRGVDLFVFGDIMGPAPRTNIYVGRGYEWNGWRFTGAIGLGMVLSSSPSSR